MRFLPRDSRISAFCLLPHGDRGHLLYVARAGAGRAGADAVRHAVSDDLIHWQERGEAFAPAATAECRHGAITGLSVAEHCGTYRVLYSTVGSSKNAGSERIGMATSEDLEEWRVDTDAGPAADARWYETAGASGGQERWAQPELHVDPATGSFTVLVSARRGHGRDTRKRACIAAAVSKDLVRWRVLAPALAPNRFPRLACPRLVRAGERWLLFYLTRTQGQGELRYARADSPIGPFERPKHDRILTGDVRAAAFLAWHGQTVAFLNGPTCAGAQDTDWAADCLSPPLLMRVRADGTPVLEAHERVLSQRNEPAFQFDARLDSDEMLVRLLPVRGTDFCFSAKIANERAHAAGLIFRTSVTGRENYSLWLGFQTGDVTLSRGAAGRAIARARCPLSADREHAACVWMTGQWIEAYVDDRLVLTHRLADRASGGFGIAVEGGAVRFREVTVWPVSPNTGGG